MRFTELNSVLSSQPAYRLSQVHQAVFGDLITDWSQASTLPLTLRQNLSEFCPLEAPVEFFNSAAGDTVKALITLSDSRKIETVLMRHGRRRTVCVSTQVGCPLGCKFCATGRLGFTRNLTADEMIFQVLAFARYLQPTGERISHVVFMGMGEPFLNYEAFIRAAEFLNRSDTFHIAARKISVSTAGIVEGIRKFSRQPLQFNLAISLHAPNQKLRQKLMPVSRSYPLTALLSAVADYVSLTGRKVMFEYLLIKDINDRPSHARQLARLMAKPLYLVNLIPYNPTGLFKPSPPAKVKEFREILERAGVKVTQRYEHGQDLQSACGQLAAKKPR